MHSRRLMDGRSPFGAIAVAFAMCAGAATLTWRLRVHSPIETKRPERQWAPLADRRPPSARPPRDGQPGGRERGDDPLAAAFERGVAAYNADDTDEAVDAFEEAVRLAPEEPEAHINLGLVYLRLQRPEDAMRELTMGASLARSQGER